MTIAIVEFALDDDVSASTTAISDQHIKQVYPMAKKKTRAVKAKSASKKKTVKKKAAPKKSAKKKK